jgi:SAM-dependent methyltransferase
MIELINPYNHSVLERKGEGYVDNQGKYFPVINGAVRIVQDRNYTDSFGFQWKKFQQTQIDREATVDTFSKDRFFTVTGWDKEDLSGKDVLEVGSGAGRFTQVVLANTKANLYSIDYSDAVSANYRNNNYYGDRLKLFQASIYDLPFPDNSFDKIFCFGVLQHTPDFKKSIKCMLDKLKPGGELVMDFYPIYGWWTKIHSKYLLRHFTKKMSHEKLLQKVENNIDWMMKVYLFFDKLKVGRLFNRFLPICDIKHTLPANLPKEALREWAILDTFDMFSPEYDNPQRISTVKKWVNDLDAEVTFSGVMKYANNIRVAVVKAVKK